MRSVLRSVGLSLVLASILASASSPVAVAQPTAEWPFIQGSPAKLGTAPGTTPEPPLRRSWRMQIEGGEGVSAAVLGAGVALATAPTKLVAFDPGDGEVMWTVDRNSGPPVAPAIAVEEGESVAVFVEGSGADDSGVVAIDLSSAEELWRTPLGNRAAGAPVIDGERVFLGAGDRSVYSLDLRSGEVVWRAETEGTVETSPAVGDGRVFAASENPGTGTAFLYAFDRATGEVAWRYSPGALSVGVSSPSFAEGMVYAGFGDRMVRAVHGRDGSLGWARPVRAHFNAVTAPALSEGSLYIPDAAGGLYRLRTDTGDVVWDHQLPASVSHGSPLVAGQSVYQGTDDGTLAAIRVATGRLVWLAHLPAGSLGALLPAGDRLLVPSAAEGGGVFAFEPDPEGTLVDVASPSELRVPEALLNYAGAFAVVLIGLVLLSRFGLGRRRMRTSRPRSSESGG